jgi:hypothetical protein
MKPNVPYGPCIVVDKNHRRSYIPHILAVLSLWVAAMSLDAKDQMDMEREAATRAAEIYEERIKLLVDCEEKKITGYYYQGRVFACPWSLGEYK